MRMALVLLLACMTAAGCERVVRYADPDATVDAGRPDVRFVDMAPPRDLAPPPDRGTADGLVDASVDGLVDASVDVSVDTAGGLDGLSDTSGGIDAAPLADGLVADTAPPAPLAPTFGGLYYEHTTATTLQVGSLVTGGTQPYGCAFYYGPGRGTVPANVSLSGCVLSGGFGPNDPPGVYGFIIVITDQSGQKLEVPIVMRNGSCNTAVAAISPAEYPIRVVAPPGSAYDWAWSITDVDSVCDGPTCGTCAGCVKSGLGTKTPLALTSFLDCAAAGDICLAGNDIQNPSSCPSPTLLSWNAQIRVKAHAPLRSDGGVAWVTVAADATYSGTATGMACGDKAWSCHAEVLEAP